MNKDALTKSEWNLISAIRKYKLLDTSGTIGYFVWLDHSRYGGEEGTAIITESAAGDAAVAEALRYVYEEQEQSRKKAK